MKSYIKLSDNDHAILNSYKSILNGLSLFFGDGFEFVLHSLDDLDNSAIKVINGHFSNRSEGAPITDLAMKLLKEIEASGDNHRNMVYRSKSKGKIPIKSATLPITGQKDRIIGLLCINFYMNIPLHSFIESFFMNDTHHEETPIIENYASNSEELIVSSLQSAKDEILNNPEITALNQNKMIVSLLNERGIFELKDAVHIVANDLKVSKNTVYLHIRNSSKKD